MPPAPDVSTASDASAVSDSSRSSPAARIEAPAIAQVADDRLIWHGVSEKIVHVEVEKDRGNPYGSVTGGHIRRETFVTTGWVLRDDQDDWAIKGRQALMLSPEGTHIILQGSADMDDDDGTVTQVACAYLAENGRSAVFMLLHPARIGAGSYVRKGIAQLNEGIANRGYGIEKLVGSITRATLTII